jgi:hypothetical protein
LAAVRKVASVLGGQIELAAHEPGTCFELAVPCPEVEAAAKTG